jgi:hypothetical protein
MTGDGLTVPRCPAVPPCPAVPADARERTSWPLVGCGTGVDCRKTGSGACGGSCDGAVRELAGLCGPRPARTLRFGASIGDAVPGRALMDADCPSGFAGTLAEAPEGAFSEPRMGDPVISVARWPISGDANWGGTGEAATLAPARTGATTAPLLSVMALPADVPRFFMERDLRNRPSTSVGVASGAICEPACNAMVLAERCM